MLFDLSSAVQADIFNHNLSDFVIYLTSDGQEGLYATTCISLPPAVC